MMEALDVGTRLQSRKRAFEKTEDGSMTAESILESSQSSMRHQHATFAFHFTLHVVDRTSLSFYDCLTDLCARSTGARFRMFHFPFMSFNSAQLNACDKNL